MGGEKGGGVGTCLGAAVHLWVVLVLALGHWHGIDMEVGGPEIDADGLKQVQMG